MTSCLSDVVLVVLQLYKSDFHLWEQINADCSQTSCSAKACSLHRAALRVLQCVCDSITTYSNFLNLDGYDMQELHVYFAACSSVCVP